MVVGVGGSRKTCQWYQRIRIDRHRWERRVYKVCITDNQQYHFPKGDSIIKSYSWKVEIPNCASRIEVIRIRLLIGQKTRWIVFGIYLRYLPVV